MKKKLRLNRETLRHLDPDDAAKAAGGTIYTPYTITLWLTSCGCETINTNATTNCTGANCTQENTWCLCPVC